MVWIPLQPCVLVEGGGCLGSRHPSDAHGVAALRGAEQSHPLAPGVGWAGTGGSWQQSKMWSREAMVCFGGSWLEGGSPARLCTAGLGRGAGSELLLAELSFPLSANHICRAGFSVWGFLYISREAKAAIFILEFPALLLYGGMCCSCRSVVVSLLLSCSVYPAAFKQAPPRAGGFWLLCPHPPRLRSAVVRGATADAEKR